MGCTAYTPTRVSGMCACFCVWPFVCMALPHVAEPKQHCIPPSPLPSPQPLARFQPHPLVPPPPGPSVHMCPASRLFRRPVCLRMQADPTNKDFSGISPERAFADYVLANLVLHLVVFNYLG